MPKKTFFLLLTVIYLITAGVSFAGFYAVLPQGTTTTTGGGPSRFAQLISPLVPGAGQGAVDVSEDAPRTEECPLNGKMYTVAERE
ncbi:hypothetical protein LRY65_05260, partial [Candidatus Woesebacteria bacterium]|nr:hypothetical protein [Candidatus Woesebacteria bacterium]